jgi:hypothetical protein
MAWSEYVEPLKRRWAQRREFDDLGPDGVDGLARDLRVSAEELNRVAAMGSTAGAGLRPLMRELSLDPVLVARTHWMVMRDLEAVCSGCKSTRRCRRECESGAAVQTYDSFCPNAQTLTALRAEMSPAC